MLWNWNECFALMFSELYGGDKEFVTSTVIVTHIASIITVPAVLSVFSAMEFIKI